MVGKASQLKSSLFSFTQPLETCQRGGDVSPRVRLILFTNPGLYSAPMNLPHAFDAPNVRRGIREHATFLLSLITVSTLISCGPLDMALFPTDDWSTVFPARVKNITVPWCPSNEVGGTSPSWRVRPATTSALAVYDCSTLCHIVISSVICQTTEDREIPCVVRLARESCLIGARTKQDHEDIVQVTCTADDDDSQREKAAGRLNPRPACALDMNAPGHLSPIPCPSLLLAPMKPTL